MSASQGGGGIEAALSVFAGLSASNGAGRQTFIGINAREFAVGEDGNGPLASVRSLTREQVDAFCPRFGNVQTRTNATYERIRSERPFASAAQLGTAVHVSLKEQIDALDLPDYRAEISAIKSRSEARPVYYGQAGTIRIDIMERVDNSTVCVYDIKTGNRGLSVARMVELASITQRIFPGSTRFVLTEIRPSRR